jgi:polygalacturonase
MGLVLRVVELGQGTISRISCLSLPTFPLCFTAKTTFHSFRDSIVTNSSNGLRIKTDYNATGSVVNVTFANIQLSNIKNYGIDIQQDYGNSGSAGIPSNGVRVAGIKFENVKGWVVPTAMDYYVLCGDGSCSDFEYRNVNISGGGKNSSCNYPASGCPSGR